jgi:hypothetical protein
LQIHRHRCHHSHGLAAPVGTGGGEVGGSLS